MSYDVTYSAWGNEVSFRLVEPQDDDVTAERKALDYYDAALASPREASAWCAVSKDGAEWLDTRWG